MSNLSGNVEARFYGEYMTELGGTFSMENDYSGYIGYFGIERDYIVLSDSITETTYVDTPKSFNSNNLRSFADSARKNTSNNAFRATAVEMTKNDDNKTMSTNRIIGSVVELDYASDKTFSGLKLYFANKKYQGSHTVNWSRDGFGFLPSYIALIDWQVDVGSHETMGYAITGFETVGSVIPTTGTVKFTGRGRGRYYEKPEQYYWEATDFIASFPIVANVDFSNRIINLASNNTCTENCISVPRYDLDFTGTLSYMLSENIISGNIETVGDDNNAKMNGIVEAQFYGTRDYAAKELGGTFTMKNNKAVYVGWFGAEKPDIIKPYIISNKTLATSAMIGADTTPTIFNINNLIGFHDNVYKNTSNNVLPALVVQATKHTYDRKITTEKITGSVVEFSEELNSRFALYFADKRYKKINNTSDIQSGSADKPYSFHLSRIINYIDDSTTDYMARVSWWVNESDYETRGYAIIGFKTDSDDIPTTNTATFIGKGTGVYYEGVAEQNLFFDTTASVDFKNRNIVLTSINTCTSTRDSNCEQVDYQKYGFNFTGNLNYEVGENIISGMIKTTGSDNYTKLTGIADAHFYGYVANEIGGIFNMANDTASYFGWFGAVRNDYFPSYDIPTAFNRNNLKSFDDTARNDTINNALKIATAVQKTVNIDNSIIINKVTDTVVEFDYGSDGEFTTNGLRLYFTDKKYNVSNGFAGQDYIVDRSPNSSNLDTLDRFELSKQSHDFGFTPNYMVLVHWVQVYENSYNNWGYNNQGYGYGITGYETTGSDIPTTNTATFIGEGEMRSLWFSVTANVDFSSLTVDLASTNTCLTSERCGRFYYLNFTGTLRYEAGENVITGNIETVGDADNAKLSGTAEARFYGANAEEIGGTFSMSNDETSYIGYFGAKR